MKQMFTLLFITGLVSSCSQVETPKPHGYFRIDFPEKSYEIFHESCPFSFNIPVYSTVTYDSSAKAEPCWLNLNFLPYNATLHLTYKPIGGDFGLLELQNDSRRFVMNHTIKAQEIVENIINKPEDHVHGILYSLKGNTATSLQFYVTDSSQHYLRGALYFNVNTNSDSIAPVLDFITEDVLNLIGTLKWSNNAKQLSNN